MGGADAAQSVTRWIRALEADRTSAVGPLLGVYFDRLVQLARKRLQDLPGMATYDEDVALRSFHSLCQRGRDPARPPQLARRHDLWRPLAPPALSPGLGPVPRHKPGEVPGDHDVELLTREPTPAEAAEMADECRRLLDLLDQPELRQIALWKVEGYTDEEIAAKLDCVPRTVRRKVQRIRLLWQHELKN